MENHPRFLDFTPDDPTYRFHEDEIRIRDVVNDTIISTPLRNHYFGAGFVYEGRLHLYAADYGTAQPWRHHKKINWTYSDDLVHWSDPVTVIESENDELIFNTAICRGADRFIMLYETDDAQWTPFTFKYCESHDLKHWTRIPDAAYSTEKYVGGPALYYFAPWYYTLYTNSDTRGKYDTRIARSRDLVHWQEAPEDHAVLSVVPDYNPDPNYPEVFELSVSDAEMCFWNGKTLVHFHSGNQQGIATLQLAEFDGPPEEWLAHYFE